MNYRKLALVGFLVLLGGLFLLNRKKMELINQNDFALQPIANTGFELSSVIHLNNPNLLSVTIVRIHEQYYLNHKQIAELDEEINQGIPGLKATEFPVSVRFSKEDLMKVAGDTFNMKNADLTVEGEISYNNFSMSDKLTVHQGVEWKP